MKPFRRKPKLLIIVLFQNLLDEEPYYARNPAPPLPGLLLAGMTPPLVDVEVLHEMVRPIDYLTDADFIALSFMDYCAPHAYEVAARFRAKGRIVVAGGKYITNFPERAQRHFDSILVGEAQGVWPRMVEDMVEGCLRPRYVADPEASLDDIPPPRYDLAEKVFSTPIVTEATRGCPHSCTFCQLNIDPVTYRMRPVADVIRDLCSTEGLPYHKRKFAMLLDNNLGGDMAYAKSLLREIAALKLWGLGVQCSIECLRDEEFVRLLQQARCRMAFLGMESLNDRSLESVKKRQNRVEEYRELFARLHSVGILTFTGLMFALDEDDSAYYESLPERLEEVNPAVILSSIAIPIVGTPLYWKTLAEGRIRDHELSHYEGDHLVFEHPTLTREDVFTAYREVNRRFFSWSAIARRWWRIVRSQRRNASLVSVFFRILIMSGIYFKLSVFQRQHATERVLQKGKGKEERRVFSAAAM
ncbi:MAG: radical SAM protein [Bacteroidetes bacterium]|nr:radical SAM protein [Bacteroidota bacterium]